MSIFPDDAADRKPLTMARATNPVADAAVATRAHFSAIPGVPPQNEVITVATRAYLDALDVDDPPSPRMVERQLMAVINQVVIDVNTKAATATEKLPLLKKLTPWQIAQTLHRIHIIKEIVPDGVSARASGVGVLGIYQKDGPDRGIYLPCEFVSMVGADGAPDSVGLEDLVQAYDPSIDERGYKETRRLVRLGAKKVPETADGNLVPVDNVIHNYSTNERIEFSPDYVFLAKLGTALPETRPDLERIADQQVPGGFWDIESWTDETHPEPGMAEHIWKVRCAMMRGRVNWRKAFLFFDPLGSTGKGTENELIRGLIGPDNCVNIPLAQFSSQFGTEPLLGALANIVDELPVGDYYKDLSGFKAAVTHDPIQIDRKYEKPISFKPHAGQLFNVNSPIESNDKTASLLRRFQIIPFAKRFIGTADNPRIKEDYVMRREVREYILYKVLVEMPKFWDLTADEPPAVKQALEEYRLETQSVAAWADDCLGQLVGPMVAFPQAYAHYYAWTKERNPASRPLSQPSFTAEIKRLLDPDEWVVPSTIGKDGRETDRQLISKTWIIHREPILEEFVYSDAVAKWLPVSGKLPTTTPRTSRGFVRRSVWETYENDGTSPADALAQAEEQRRRDKKKQELAHLAAVNREAAICTCPDEYRSPVIAFGDTGVLPRSHVEGCPVLVDREASLRDEVDEDDQTPATTDNEKENAA